MSALTSCLAEGFAILIPLLYVRLGHFCCFSNLLPGSADNCRIDSVDRGISNLLIGDMMGCSPDHALDKVVLQHLLSFLPVEHLACPMGTYA